MTYLQQRHAAGEIVIGLLFVDPDSGDMHDFLDTVEAPLNSLGTGAKFRFNVAHR